ncbi:hypothetical protein QTP88_011444 [Uroleucon formosanum]
MERDMISTWFEAQGSVMLVKTPYVSLVVARLNANPKSKLNIVAIFTKNKPLSLPISAR